MKESDAFEEFHGSLKLNPKEVAFAQGFPDEVRAALKNGGVHITHSFLQGSLARGTMVSPPKDVDMVVSLDWGSYADLLWDPDDPDKAMDLIQCGLENHLHKKYPKPRFGPRKRHALPIELGDGYPSFDLVPAFETLSKDDDVLIADREKKSWKRSNPRQLQRVVATANQSAEGRLIHVVRMVKHAVRNNLSREFPGLALESFAIEGIRRPMPYAEGSASVFRIGAALLGGRILDPTKQDNLAPKIDEIAPSFTQTAKKWFTEQADNARRARRCAESGDHRQSIAWWYRIFGPPFPSLPNAQSPHIAVTALVSGPSSPRRTRAWGYSE